MTWRPEVAPETERDLDRLPSRAAQSVVEFMVGRLVDDPLRVGHRIQRELTV